MPPERLGDYLRAFDALLDAARVPRACPTATSATGACTSGSTSTWRPGRGAPATGRSSRRPRGSPPSHGGSLSGEHGDGRARSELLPADVRRGGARPDRRGQAALRPGQPAQPRGARGPGAARRRRPAGRRAGATGERPFLALHARRRRPRRGGPPLHRRRQVPRRQHRVRRRDVPVVPGDPRREGLHPRPRARAAGRSSPAGSRAGGTRRRVEDALDLCLACKGCARDCPTGVDMATYKAEWLHRKYAGRRRPLHPLHAGPAARSCVAKVAARAWPTSG